MKNAFVSTFWAALALAFTFAMVLRPDVFGADTRSDVTDVRMTGLGGAGLSLTWLAISVSVFLWRFREWRDSRFVNFVYFR